jgi:hypothetical protein
MHIASIGIDLGKTTFHLVGLAERSKLLFRKKFSPTQLLAYAANLPPSLIGLERKRKAASISNRSLLPIQNCPSARLM